MGLSIFVDCDSLPLKYRQVILRRAVRSNIRCVFAADREIKDVVETIKEHTIALRAPLRATLSKEEIRKVKSTISMVVVETGANSADDYLVSVCETPAICVTHDIPLAARMIEKGAIALDDRGDILNSDNIRERLSIREVMYTLREGGIFNDKQKRMDNRTLMEFSAAFDKLVSSYGL